MGVVLDSSVLIAAERGRFDWVGFQRTLIDEPQFLTAITLSELRHGLHRAKNDEQRERRGRFIARIECYPILSFTAIEAVTHAQIWADLEESGNRIGAHDLLIAAVALHHGHRLATLNAGEFQRIAGLTVINAEAFRM